MSRNSEGRSTTRFHESLWNVPFFYITSFFFNQTFNVTFIYQWRRLHCKVSALLSGSGSRKHPRMLSKLQTSLQTSEIGSNQRWIATRLLQEAPEVNTGWAKSIFTALKAVISTGQAMWGHDLTCVILWSHFLACLGLAYCATVNPGELCRMVCHHLGWLFLFFFFPLAFSDMTRFKNFV